MTTPTLSAPDQPLPVRAYGTLATGGSYLQSTVLLMFRLAWGWVLYLSGYRHLHNIEQMIHRFEKWGVPFPSLSVHVSGATELVGGLLLIFGVATRLVSVPLVFNFLVAIGTAGSNKVKQAVFGGNPAGDDYNPGRLGGLEAIISDDAFPFLMLSLLLLAFGPGKASVDYLLQRTVFRRHTEPLGHPARRDSAVEPTPGGAGRNILS